MKLITPPFLKKGDVVGIVAPARKVTQSDVEPAIGILKGWGLDVILGEHLYESYNQFSGTDEQRANDLQSMIENDHVKAIICARGGYGSIRLLDSINLRALQRSPKWLVGYSDISVFHGILNSWYMVETIHGPMPVNFPSDGVDSPSTQALRDALFGHVPHYSCPNHELNRIGKSVGLLCGGNLSIILSVARTNADIITGGKILFIEDLDEYLYHIDRMMMNLKHSGKLDGLAGLVIGSMNGMNDNTIPYGYNAYDIVWDAVKDYSYPVCFGFPAGHQDPNLSLILGRRVTLTVTEEGVSLEFHPPPMS